MYTLKPRLIAIFGLCFASALAQRNFTVINNCPFTIWPAIFTGSVVNGVPAYSTGWQAEAYTSVSFTVPNNWTAGRIWGRRDCNFTAGSTSPTTCLDGGCNGGLLCDPQTGTGVPPATVAEWTLGGTAGQDNYDVSLVDGYNLPMSVVPTSNCPVASCPVDLGPLCPAALAGPYDSTGFPIGCKSACSADIDGDPGNSPNCCTGNYSTPQTCPNTDVAYYWFFKGNCPRAYAYAYDESSGTALWTCPASNMANYTVTFCPAGDPSTAATVTSSASTSASGTSTSLSVLTTTQGVAGSPGPQSASSSDSSLRLRPLRSLLFSACWLVRLVVDWA